MIRTANISDVENVIPLWGGDIRSVEHLGDRGNSVFSFKTLDGRIQILRCTDPDFRSFDDLLGELHFVNHLHAAGVPVAECVSTIDGRLAIVSPCKSGNMVCSSVAYAPGVEVLDTSSHWNADFFREWGRNLGLIHKEAAALGLSGVNPKRWQWNEENIIARAEQLIPSDDVKSLDEFREVMGRCRLLPKDQLNFGLIHADHAPQNFRYDPEQNRITTFDFGNCCYHWFVSDLAISLSTVRRRPNRQGWLHNSSTTARRRR